MSSPTLPVSDGDLDEVTERGITPTTTATNALALDTELDGHYPDMLPVQSRSSNTSSRPHASIRKCTQQQQNMNKEDISNCSRRVVATGIHRTTNNEVRDDPPDLYNPPPPRAVKIKLKRRPQIHEISMISDHVAAPNENGECPSSSSVNCGGSDDYGNGVDVYPPLMDDDTQHFVPITRTWVLHNKYAGIGSFFRPCCSTDTHPNRPCVALHTHHPLIVCTSQGILDDSYHDDPSENNISMDHAVTAAFAVAPPTITSALPQERCTNIAARSLSLSEQSPFQKRMRIDMNYELLGKTSSIG
jgi:hypothetical protein